MSEILSSKLKSSEIDRNRDPFEIFDELDHERIERGYGAETLGVIQSTNDSTADPDGQNIFQGINAVSPEILDQNIKEEDEIEEEEEEENLKNGKRSIFTNNGPNSVSDFRDSELSTASNKKSRRLPIVLNSNTVCSKGKKMPPKVLQNWHGFTGHIPQIQRHLNSNAIYPHRRLPNINSLLQHRRQLPQLDAIIENPYPKDFIICNEVSSVDCHDSLLLDSVKFKSTRKRLPNLAKIMIDSSKETDEAPAMKKCNGKATAYSCIPLNLVRTETETTYLTSSLGEPSNLRSPSNIPASLPVFSPTDIGILSPDVVH